MCSAGISPSVLPVVVLGAAISSPWGRHEELAEITWPQTASAAKNLFPIRQQHARSAAFALVVAHFNKYGSALAQTGIASAQESQKYDDESMFFEPIRPTTPLLDKPASVNFAANPDAATKRSQTTSSERRAVFSATSLQSPWQRLEKSPFYRELATASKK